MVISKDAMRRMDVIWDRCVEMEGGLEEIWNVVARFFMLIGSFVWLVQGVS